MPTTFRRSYLVGLACALSLPVSALIAHAWAEIGMNDDWSYIRSAQALARTGHIAYNGWSTAALGWQLFLGALSIKIFGFSFSAVRATTLLIAMLTAFLFQRILVRTGTDEWLSLIGTLTLVLSPLFMPLAFGYMTDVQGLFVILLCVHACLRATTASSPRAAFAWICFACVSNAVGGTVRQIAWLGVLVTVPCTLWLLRRKLARFLVPGMIVTCTAVLFIRLSLQWFSRQPFALPEHLIPAPITYQVLTDLVWNLTYAAVEFPFFLLPVLVLFLPALRRMRWTFLVLPLAFLLLGRLVFDFQHQEHVGDLLFPSLANGITLHGLVGGTPIHGTPPTLLPTWSRLFVSEFCLLTTFSFFVFVIHQGPEALRGLRGDEPYPAISWKELGWIVVPLTCAYLLLLCSRGAFVSIFDRYLLAPIAIALVLLCRYYCLSHGPVRHRAFAIAAAALGLFAGFAIAGTHDLFARFRAQRSAIAEIQNAGLPPTQIDGGLEFNGWTQIGESGYVSDPRVFGASLFYGPASGPCNPQMSFLFPSLRPRFGLSFQPGLCKGASDFAPVPYSTWLPFRHRNVYVFREDGSIKP